MATPSGVDRAGCRGQLSVRRLTRGRADGAVRRRIQQDGWSLGARADQRKTPLRRCRPPIWPAISEK